MSAYDIRSIIFALGQHRVFSRGLGLVDGSGAQVATIEYSEGTPEGSITAAAGSICLDVTNGAVYTKGSGTGSTGWLSAGAVAGQSGLVLPSEAGAAVKVDLTTPSYTWRDIIGNVQPKATGAGSPARAIYSGGVHGDYAFALNDVCDFGFHIPHDYVPGTDIFFHVHWSHNDDTSVTGNATFSWYHTYAKGHDQAVFPAEKQIDITYATVNIGTTPRYRHRIDEVIMSGESATATLMDRDLLEADGLVKGTVKLSAIPTFGNGGKLFIHTCDIHYLSSNIGTANKTPDFFGVQR